MTEIVLGFIGFTVLTTSQIIPQDTIEETYPLVFTKGDVTSPYLKCPESSIHWTYTLYTHINNQEVNMTALLYINDVLQTDIIHTTNHTHQMTFNENDIITMSLVYNGTPVADSDIDVQMTLYTLKM